MEHFVYDPQSQDAEYYELLQSLIENWEYEIVEFKSASGQYSPDKIGQYFSAISNEANLKNQQYGWFILGVSEIDNKQVVGTSFKAGDHQLLEKFKFEIAKDTTDGISFMDIIELYPMNNQQKKCRVLMFKVPAAVAGIPTAWKTRYYARDGQSLVSLQQYKIDQIRSQERKDWSKLIINGATFADLDPEAIALAREKYKEKMNREHISEEVDKQTDEQFLTQLKLIVNGKVTNAAMILLGKEGSDHYFETPPKIMWRLFGADGSDKDYEIFSIPFISITDKILKKIRNLRYRYLPNQQSLFTQETDQYDRWLLREILNNSIAHANYQLGGRIYVNEFEDRISVSNPGDFLPESIETVLRPGYNPPFYRNQRLADGMVKFHMIDTATSGIRKVYRIQRDKYFPMPDYEFATGKQVTVTIYGKVLNEKYTNLLFANHDLDLETVFLLDQVQKGTVIDKHDADKLKTLGLIEGRYPNIFVSYKIAEAIGDRASYVRNKGLEDEVCIQLIISALKRGPAKKKDLFDSLQNALPGLTEEKKSKKLSNLLQKMRREDMIDNHGKTLGTEWFLK